MSNTACGTFFEVWEIPFLKMRKNAVISGDEDTSKVPWCEDLGKRKACIVLRRLDRGYEADAQGIAHAAAPSARGAL